jgi:hypothetical protein
MRFGPRGPISPCNGRTLTVERSSRMTFEAAQRLPRIPSPRFLTVDIVLLCVECQDHYHPDDRYQPYSLSLSENKGTKISQNCQSLPCLSSVLAGIANSGMVWFLPISVSLGLCHILISVKAGEYPVCHSKKDKFEKV